MTTSMLERTDHDVVRVNSPAKPECAHIVKDHDTERDDPGAALMEARIDGTALTALCGYMWVPTKSAKGLPVCAECVEIFEATVNDDDKSVPDEQ